MSDVEKPCHFCGRSCVGQPRGKDPRGRYYHTACLDAQKAGAAPVSARPESSAPTESDDLLIFDDDPGAPLEIAAPATPFGADAAGPCAGCGHPLPAGAVICMNCGYNQSSGRALKSKVKRAQSVGGSGGGGQPFEVGRFIVALLSTLFGAAAVLYGIVLIVAVSAAADMGPVPAGSREYQAGYELGQKMSGAVVGLVVIVPSLLLLLGGIFTMVRHNLGYKMLRAWAILQVIVVVGCLGPLTLLGLLAGPPDGAPDGARGAAIVGVLLGFGVMLFWPTVILMWQSRAQHDLNTWR